MNQHGPLHDATFLLQHRERLRALALGSWILAFATASAPVASAKTGAGWLGNPTVITSLVGAATMGTLGNSVGPAAVADPEGTVHGSDGSGIASALVIGFDRRNKEVVRTRTDLEGRFSFPSVEELGSFRVERDGFLSTTLKLYEAGKATPTLEPPYALTLAPGAAMKLLLRWDDGQPIANASVELSSIGGEAWWSPGSTLAPHDGLLTDTEGRVSLPGLPPRALLNLEVEAGPERSLDPKSFQVGSARTLDLAQENELRFERPARVTIEWRGSEEDIAGIREATIAFRRTDSTEEAVRFVPEVDGDVVYGLRRNIPYHVTTWTGRVIEESVQLPTIENFWVVDALGPDIVPHEQAPHPSQLADEPWNLHWTLVDSRGSPLSFEQIRAAGLDVGDLQLHYGPLDPRAEVPEGIELQVLLGLDGNHLEELRGTAQLRVSPPLWAELRVRDQRQRIDKVVPEDAIELRLDLDAIDQVGEVRLRAFDLNGTELQLVNVLVEHSLGLQNLSPIEAGPIEAGVPAGTVHYRAAAVGHPPIYGSFELGPGLVELDLRFPPGAVLRGRIDPPPEAAERFNILRALPDSTAAARSTSSFRPRPNR